MFELSATEQDDLSARTRLLGDFHGTSEGGAEIDDPLYGNHGGQQEREAVRACASTIETCCEELAGKMMEEIQVRGAQNKSELRKKLLLNQSSQDFSSFLPPMLSK